MYTERPIYRLGEEVFYKGVVRQDDDAVYSVPQSLDDLKLTIFDAEGNEIVSKDVTLNEFGTFASSIELPADGPHGELRHPAHAEGLERRSDLRPLHHRHVLPCRRVPSPRVPGRRPRRPSPTTSAATRSRPTSRRPTTSAAPLAGAKVDWSALSSPASVSFEDYERYSFSDYDYYRQATTFQQPLRSNGTVETGDDGIAHVEVPAEIQGNEGTQRYQICASVLDASGQAVGASVDVLVHPAGGLRGHSHGGVHRSDRPGV